MPGSLNACCYDWWCSLCPFASIWSHGMMPVLELTSRLQSSKFRAAQPVFLLSLSVSSHRNYTFTTSWPQPLPQQLIKPDKQPAKPPLHPLPSILTLLAHLSMWRILPFPNPEASLLDLSLVWLCALLLFLSLAGSGLTPVLSFPDAWPTVISQGPSSPRTAPVSWFSCWWAWPHCRFLF